MGNLTHTVSGDIASFRSAARVPIESLKCHFKPKQDLHGYSKPWPGGGGKNLLNVSIDNKFGNSKFINNTTETSTGFNIGNSDVNGGYWVKVTPNTTYTYSYISTYNGFCMHGRVWEIQEKTNNWDTASTNLLVNQTQWPGSATFTTGENTNWIIVGVYAYSDGMNSSITNMQIELGSTATAYEPYENICPIEGWDNIITYKARKNLAHVVGWTAQTTNSITETRKLSNSYGTTINTVNFIGETGELNVIQPQTTHPEQANHYGNGYFDAVLDNLKFEQTYTVSFKISNIINNPLEATLSNLSIGNPYGNRYYNSEIINNRVIFHNYVFKQNPDRPERTCIDIRNCGMSFTISEFMVTEEGISNQEWEPYRGDIIPITFPTTGKNKLNPNDIIISNNFELVNNIYQNTNTDTRDSCQLAVQLWRTTGSYIKTAITVSNVPIGRFSATFNVDTEECKYICLKYNGKTRDFILLFPLRLGLRQYTISCDVLANDPTTIGGVQLSNIQLEVGDSATEYEPYIENNTIYGGYVDIAKGEVVETYASIILDGSSDESWSTSGDTLSWSNETFVMPWNVPGRLSSNPEIYDQCICDGAIISTNRHRDPQDINGIHVSLYHYSNIGYHAPLGANATVTQLRAYLAEHPLHLIQPYVKESLYKHYPLSSIELKAFLDRNNLWSNTNDSTEVSYQIHDSYMIQAIKRMAAENNTHYRKVLWNNFQQPFSTTYYKAYMDSRSKIEDVEPGIIKHTYLVTNDTGYRTSTRMKDAYEPTVYTTHKYYLSYMLYTPMANKQFGAEAFGGTTLNYGVIPANQWTRLSFIGNGIRDGSGFGYFGILRTYASGDEMYTLLKAPLYVDLTVMFGKGNEPTKEEFEALCQLNNIDLTETQPYDSGTEKYWCIPNRDVNKYIQVDWNQMCKPLTTSNYKSQNSSYTTISALNEIMTVTLTQDVSQVYQSSFVSNYSISWDTSHKYYYKQEINPSVNTTYALIYRSKWGFSKTISANTWTTLQYINTPDSSSSSPLYLTYNTETNVGGVTGVTCQVKNPIFVDLTQMFGAGNEPTTASEFRAMCLKNNIDLDNAQAYNTGTKMIWKV